MNFSEQADEIEDSLFDNQWIAIRQELKANDDDNSDLEIDEALEEDLDNSENLITSKIEQITFEILFSLSSISQINLPKYTEIVHWLEDLQFFMLTSDKSDFDLTNFIKVSS
ncbi:hypothetical protein HK096_000840 [Nowakowskiella sp. JEL0078]|nr:hypothetical protein HK096_000840 [Nowakowskiella sp. JEL0078]